jgi:hypothetical protein
MKLQDFQTSLVFVTSVGCMLAISYTLHHRNIRGNWLERANSLEDVFALAGVGSVPFIAAMVVHEYLTIE